MHKGGQQRARGGEVEREESIQGEKTSEATDGGNLCHSDLSLCHTGGAQGFPQPGQRDKLGPM